MIALAKSKAIRLADLAAERGEDGRYREFFVDSYHA